MKTLFLLMAQFDGRAIVPLGEVCRAFFPHLAEAQFLRKVSAGEIKLPLIRIEASQKAIKSVHLSDLAQYIDERRDAAQKEMQQLKRCG